MNMSNGVTAGVFANLADLQASRARINTKLELLTGERYSVDLSDLGVGVLLANGNYANPIDFTTDTTVNIPTNYDTIQEAINDIHNKRLPQSQSVVNINIESGHVLTDGFRVQDGDYSYFKISSVDSVVNVSASMNLVSNTDLDESVPRSSAICFLAVRAKMPVWDVMVDVSALNVSAGYELDYGSKGTVATGKGIKNTNDGAGNGTNARITTGSYLNAAHAVFTGAQGQNVGVTIDSEANLEEANCTDGVNTGVDVSRGSKVYAQQLDVSGCDLGVYIRRSWASLGQTNMNDCISLGAWIAIGSRVVLTDATFDNCPLTIRVDDGSLVECGGATRNATPLSVTELDGVKEFNSVQGKGLVLNKDKVKNDVGYINASSVVSAVDVVNAQSVAATTYFTAVNLTGSYRIHSATIYGRDAGARVTVDGVVVIDDGDRAIGQDSASNDISVISLPPMTCESSILIEIYNRSSVTNLMGFKAYRETL